MKTTNRDIHFGAIALFYVIALVLRLTTLIIGNRFPVFKENYLFQLSTGLGPAIGAIVAMTVFKRKTEYSIMGKSRIRHNRRIEDGRIMSFGIYLWAVGRIWLARVPSIRT